MKVLLTGGGTAGSVVPLLAVVKKLNLSPTLIGEKQKQETGLQLGSRIEFLFLGTRKGIPEKRLVGDIPYKSIFSGKLRRYFSWQNFIDPFLFFLGFWQSIFIILKFKPNIILSAGSFVSVPVIWAGWLLGVPSLIHQQDIRPGLANKLMAPFASRITVTFKKSLKDFSQRKTVWTGNPVREEILLGDKNKASEIFNLENNLPTILVMGGGTGALKLNTIIVQLIPELTRFCQIIHLTGQGKKIIEENRFSRYHPYEFLEQELKDAYAVADLVISRAGLSSLTELSALGKPSIVIPIPDSHQEENAEFFKEKKAAIVIEQKNINAHNLLNQVRILLNDSDKLNSLSNNIKKIMKPNASQKIANIVLKTVKVNYSC